LWELLTVWVTFVRLSVKLQIGKLLKVNVMAKVPPTLGVCIIDAD
jgi:hypothetical protein